MQINQLTEILIEWNSKLKSIETKFTFCNFSICQRPALKKRVFEKWTIAVFCFVCVYRCFYGLVTLPVFL